MERHCFRLALLASLAFLSAAAFARVGAEEVEDREAALLFNTASRFYRQKNWEDAASTFAEFLKKHAAHPDAAEARFAAGYCLYRVGKHAAAVELLRLSIRDENTAWSADSHFYLARSLEAIAGESKSDPEERARRLIASAESYGKAASLYAKDMAGAGARDPAQPGGTGGTKEASREKARDFHVLALSAQGEALYQAERHNEANQALAPLLKEAETLGVSQYYQRGVYVLGLARQALAKKAPAGASPRFAEARAALEQASQARFEKESLWEEAAYLLARLSHQDGDLEKAVAEYGAVVRKGGGRAAEAAYYRGLSLYELQKPESLAKSREELGRFLREQPKHALAPKARFYEALCAFDLKDYGSCEAAFGTVAQESPDLAGRALLRRGQSLLLKSEPNPAEAAQALGKAAELLAAEALATPSDATLPERAAEALYWQGEALLSVNGRLADAAGAFGAVGEKYAKEAPELAEKGLYQKARALYLSGQHGPAAEAAELYRRTYPDATGSYYAESLLLSAECAFHAPAASIPEALRREAPRFYREAAMALKGATEARRARYMAGVALYFLGEHRQAGIALEELRVEASKDPQVLAAFPELSFYLADSLAQEPRREPPSSEDRERWQRAVGHYNEYLEKSKDGTHLPNALVNLGLCQEWLHDHDAARRTFERFLTQFPSHALSSQVRFELGNTRLVAGDLEAAALAYASAADAAPEESKLLAARALYQKAMLERKLGKAAAAGETLTGLLAKHGEGLKGDPQGQKVLRDAAYQRSVALLEAGKGEEARGELSQFLEQNAGSPQEVEARNQLARSLLDAGKPQEALKVLESTLAAGAGQEGRDQALYLAAWCHSALASVKDAPDSAQRREEMEASYRRLIAEHPQSSLVIDSMLELGQNLFNRKAHAEAKKWLEQVRETLETTAGPGFIGTEARTRELLERSLFGLGFIAFEDGDFAAAAKTFDRVLENAQSTLAPRSAFQAGRAFMKQGDFAEAAKRFERMADEFRSRAEDLHEESLLRLGESLHQTQKYAEAVKALDRQLKEHAEGELRHEARFARGFALQFSGDFDGAVESYRAVVAGTRQPVAARAQYHIGECRVEQGRHRDAAKEFITAAANFDFDGPYREWVRRSLLAAGMAFESVQDTGAAQAQFRELLERFPESEEGKSAEARLKALGSK